MSQEFLRYAAAAVTVLLMAWMIGFGVYLRRKGVNANAVAQKNSNWIQRALIVGAGVLDLYLVLRAPFPALDAFVRAAPSLSPVFAFTLMLAGAATIAASQFGMGQSWRVGVPKDENHVDALVMSGMHRFSRNPVYLGIMIFLAGAALAAPGPLTIAGLVLSYCGLTLIIRQEERYLAGRFGERYDTYRRRVRRWI